MSTSAVCSVELTHCKCERGSKLIGRAPQCAVVGWVLCVDDANRAEAFAGFLVMLLLPSTTSSPVPHNHVEGPTARCGHTTLELSPALGLAVVDSWFPALKIHRHCTAASSSHAQCRGCFLHRKARRMFPWGGSPSRSLPDFLGSPA